MAAAIPATNKWLLTKQASVALSGPWDDSYGASGGAGEREAGRTPDRQALARESQGRDETRRDGRPPPRREAAYALPIPEEPSGGRKQEGENEKE